VDAHFGVPTLLAIGCRDVLLHVRYE